ncbi:hypothetical protein IIA79_02260 [bacterium]|nr:hypothetical protein [bacterium]
MELIQQFNIIKELWELGERPMLRRYLSQVIDHIDLRTDGQQLVGTVYLRNLPELNVVQRFGGGGFRDAAQPRFTITLPLRGRAQMWWLAEMREQLAS